MTSSGSDWMLIKEDATPIETLAECLLVSISEIIEFVACMDIEQEIFMDIGCYFYRACPAIKELQATENTTADTMEILQSLSESIDLAKDLVEKCQKGICIIPGPKLRNIIEQLEGVIRCMGERLALVPSAASRDQEYAEVAIRSISKEMQNAHFSVSQTQVTELEPQTLSWEEQSRQEPEAIETDLYSINFEVSTENPQLDMSNLQVIEFPKTMSYGCPQRNHGSTNNGPLVTLPQLAQCTEPLYKSFFCPLTKRIMEDPVTIESGMTYERKAIIEWFEKFKNSKEIFCPTTGQKLMSRIMRTNIALKTTIEEWEERNETTRIKAARAALSLGSSESMVLEALKDLQNICQRTSYNKVQIRNVGIIPLLVTLLEYKDSKVRCATLELLQLLAEDDDDGKEMIGMVMDISTIIKMLSSNQQPIKHASLLLLLELSRSKSLCEKIGSASGGILMLIITKYNQSVDTFASEKAGETLRNLERSPNNIKCMAENGFLEPLLNHLIEGCEETKMEMGSYLGEIVLGRDSKIYVAEKASPALIKMVQSGNTLTRRAAFKALIQISSYHTSAKTLVEAGIVQVMIDEMFTRIIYNEPMNSKKEAAIILANIVESGLNLETLKINTHGHTLSSDYFLYNIIHMIKSSTPDELNISLIRILLSQTKFQKSTAAIVSLIKETEASYSIIELINNPYEELGVAAIKLLITLSPYMGHTLADKLCKTRGQPESLIQSPIETTQITEKQALSATLLAKLPHQNLTLNLALLSKNTVPIILQSINQMQRSGSRHASACLEGLVGVLVRFTTTLYEPQMLFLASNYNFTSIFTELLMKTSSDEVQRLSAIGLENLSSESTNLSKQPQIRRSKFMKLFYLPKCLTTGSSKDRKIQVCPVHRGVCSAQITFCLFEAKAVERLLTCLSHENVEVVEAALSAICTLLDDKVDVDISVNMLSSVNAIQHVLHVLREHRQENLQAKSFWVIERFLMKGGEKSASDISQDKLLPATLVSAFHHGHGNMKQMAEKILKHLNNIPNFTSTYTYTS
ncbi:putative U-box domain-containing protein 42 [Malania oleifera]|uniref:putative U-box domain-containing protein 42 n=1 Tax=Malania oleifera TaxID=397392 RepID=UPI0025ADA8DF|nr:putative U-box domain-containing protein 42 [Malania oleifera]